MMSNRTSESGAVTTDSLLRSYYTNGREAANLEPLNIAALAEHGDEGAEVAFTCPVRGCGQGFTVPRARSRDVLDAHMGMRHPELAAKPADAGETMFRVTFDGPCLYFDAGGSRYTFDAAGAAGLYETIAAFLARDPAARERDALAVARTLHERFVAAQSDPSEYPAFDELDADDRRGYLEDAEAAIGALEAARSGAHGQRPSS